MNHTIRRKDRELSIEKTNELLNQGEYGILGTVDKDGWPYTIPLNYVVVQDKIYFHCAKDVGHKISNIRENNKVSFTVVGKTKVQEKEFSTLYESVVVFGTVKEEIENKKAISIALIEKYSQDFIAEGLEYIDKMLDYVGIYEITKIKQTGKAKVK